MVRPGSNPSGSSHQQPQAPETIDDAPPPPFESESHQENEPSVNFQTRSPVNAHHHEPQAFPPTHQDHHHLQEDEPQEFPPQFDAQKPQSFPPPQHEQPQSFPPQSQPDRHQQPHAFPPPQGAGQQAGGVHSFPPSQHDHQQPHAFPPTQGGQQAGVQSFPPQQPTFHHPNTPPAGHGGQYVNAPSPMHQQMRPNSPFLNSNPQVMMNNGVPVQQGFPLPQPIPTEPWQTDLFGCMDDPTNALITACFPCVTFGQIAEIIDSGQTSCATSGMLYGCIAFFIAMPCLISCTYRTKLRSRYGLIETPGPDWMVHCFCEWCALCQEYRELQKRGIDPSIGWHGNLARAQQQVQLGAMKPPGHQNMMA